MMSSPLSSRTAGDSLNTPVCVFTKESIRFQTSRPRPPGLWDFLGFGVFGFPRWEERSSPHEGSPREVLWTTSTVTYPGVQGPKPSPSVTQVVRSKGVAGSHLDEGLSDKTTRSQVPCLPAPNITCRNFEGKELTFSGREVGFYKAVPCRHVNGYSYKVAVALSLFLGWLGADRFYLGYPALGLLKFCTVGFCGIASLIDFILISMQIVGPSDGSSYIVDYYGARLVRLGINNETYRKTQMSP
ncbi:TM2D1 protein, partial [Polypterus senegalus]